MSDQKRILDYIHDTNRQEKLTGISAVQSIVLDNLNIKENLHFDKCIFRHSFTISNTDLSGSFTFTNCQFLEGLNINNVNVTQNIGLLVLSKGSINKINLNNSNLDQIRIENYKSLIEEININECKIKYIYTQFCHAIRIINIIKVQSELFKATTIDIIKDIDFTSSIIEKVSFNGIKYEAPLIGIGEFQNKFLEISNSEFNNYVSFGNPLPNAEYLEDSAIEIKNSIFKNDLIYRCYNYKENKGYRNIEFSGNKITGTLSIAGNFLKRSYAKEGLTYNASEVNKVEIHISAESTGSIELSYLDCEYVRFEGINSKSHIHISEIDANNFHFYKFMNYGNISMVNCFNNELKKIKHRNFKVDDCLLNNLTLLSTNLNQFDEVNINDSSLSNLKANNTSFFTYEKLQHTGSSIRSIYYYILANNILSRKPHRQAKYLMNKREVYKQLKLSMEQSGDKIKALEFKSYEMKAYHYYLIASKRFILSEERLILIFSSVNNYGLNWIKALLIAVITMFLIYWVILIQTHPSLEFKIDLSTTSNTFKILVDNINVFFTLLNPIHEVSKVYVKPLELSGWTYFVDYFSRIAISFFITQVVSAFRKYAK